MVKEQHNGLYAHAALTGQPWQGYLPREKETLRRLYDLLMTPGVLDFEDSRTGPVLGRSDRIECIKRTRKCWEENESAYEDSLANPNFLPVDGEEDGQG